MELFHFGVKDQRWYHRRWQYPDGSLTPEGRIHYGYSNKDTVFLSGKVRYDEKVRQVITQEIDKMIEANSHIVIGDAPGADTRMQEYLKEKGYLDVVVYTTDSEARNNVGNWKVNNISGKKHKDERHIRREKDKAMTKASTKGFGISSIDDDPQSAMSLNIKRLKKQGKPVVLFDYKQNKIFYM